MRAFIDLLDDYRVLTKQRDNIAAKLDSMRQLRAVQYDRLPNTPDRYTDKALAAVICRDELRDQLQELDLRRRTLKGEINAGLHGATLSTKTKTVLLDYRDGKTVQEIAKANHKRADTILKMLDCGAKAAEANLRRQSAAGRQTALKERLRGQDYAADILADYQ